MTTIFNQHNTIYAIRGGGKDGGADGWCVSCNKSAVS